MNIYSSKQIGKSADKETFICIKYAALFGLCTWTPVGVEVMFPQSCWFHMNKFAGVKGGCSSSLASGIQKANSSE